MNLHLIGFLGIFSAGLILTVLSDLSWGVALYEFLYFVFPVNRWWYTIPRFRYTFLVGIVLIVVYLFRKRSSHRPASTPLLFPQAKILLVMIGLMGVISFWAVWPEQHTRFLILQIQQLIFMIIAYQAIDGEDKFDRVLWTYLAGCFYVGYLAQGMPRDEFGRLEGMGMPDGPEANTTAAVLITAVPLLIHQLTTGKLLQKGLALLFFPFIVNAVILLNSRGAFLALALAALYYLVLFLHQKIVNPKRRLAACCVSIVCLGLFFYLTDATFWARMGTIREVEAGIGTATRTNFWLAAIESVQDYPFGLGARGFEFLSPTILPEEWLNPRTGTIAVHSTYFEALTDFGYLGVPLIAAFLFTTLNDTRRVKKEAIKRVAPDLYIKALALESSYIAYLLAIVFINRLYAEAFYWLMLFAATFRKVALGVAQKPPVAVNRTEKGVTS